MLFNGDMVRSDHLVILSYMVPRLSISGHYDVIWKKSKKYYLRVFFLFLSYFFVMNISTWLSALFMLQNGGILKTSFLYLFPVI